MTGAARERSSSKHYIYGVNPVLEAIRSQPRDIERLYVARGGATARTAADLLGRARSLGIEIHEVDRDRISELAQGGVHQGLVAQMRAFEYAALEDLLIKGELERPLLVVVLDGIQDPQNLGAVIRSAHAFGAHGVVIPKDRSAPVTPAATKASAGATQLCPVAQVVNLSRALGEIKEAGAWIAAADPKSQQAVWDANLAGPLAVVVGGEGSGIRPGVLKQCDFRLRIPMNGEIGSLNASVATAILLYEITRCRRLNAGA